MDSMQSVLLKGIYNAQAETLKMVRAEIRKNQISAHEHVADLSGATIWLHAYDQGVDMALRTINRSIETALTLAAKE